LVRGGTLRVRVVKKAQIESLLGETIWFWGISFLSINWQLS